MSAASAGNYSANQPGNPSIAQTQHSSAMYNVPFQQTHGLVRNHETVESLYKRGLDSCYQNPPQHHTLPEKISDQNAYHATTPYQQTSTLSAGHPSELSQTFQEPFQEQANPYQNLSSRAFKSGRGNLLNHRVHGSGGSQFAANPAAGVQSDADSAPFNNSE